MENLQEVQEAIAFYRDHKRKQLEIEALKGVEIEPSTWQKIRQSQYWDFVLYGALLLSLTLVIHFIYLSITTLGGFLPAEVLEKLSNLPTTGLIFIFGIGFVDFKFLAFERIFYKYSKRNGVNTFDYQESFKSLTEWQKVLIYTIKSLFYLLVFVLIYKA